MATVDATSNEQSAKLDAAMSNHSAANEANSDDEPSSNGANVDNDEDQLHEIELGDDSSKVDRKPESPQIHITKNLLTVPTSEAPSVDSRPPEEQPIMADPPHDDGADDEIKPDTTQQINREMEPTLAEQKSISRNKNNKPNDVEANNVKPKKVRSANGWVRHMVAILALSSIVLANMNRQCFNQALVSMIRPSRTNDIESTTISSTKAPPETTTPAQALPPDTDEIEPVKPSLEETVTSAHETINEKTNSEHETISEPLDDRFDWTAAQIGTLQAAFSYGYTPFMIPGGRLSEIYGAKWIVLMSGLGSALCCMIAPFAADYSFTVLVASRVFMGLCQTGVSPALYALLARWLPPTESTVYLPMIKVGVMLGFMSGSLISGFFHWRTTFYLVGGIGALWSILWFLTVSSDPGDSHMISEPELDYIQMKIQRANNGRKLSMGSQRKKSAPWLAILTSPIVLAFMFTKFTNKLSTDTQSMQIPMYLKEVFGVSKELNGLLSGLNFALQAFFTGPIAWAAKEMIRRRTCGLNKTRVRHLFQGICNFGMMAAYGLIGSNSSALSIVCVCAVMNSIFAMFGAGGESVVPIDLSLEYSASIMAIANCAANLSGIILPPMVAYLLSGQLDSVAHWRQVWFTVAAIMMSGGLAFVLVFKAQLQDFGKGGSHSEKQKDKAESGECEAMNTEVAPASVHIELADRSKVKARGQQA